MPVPSGCHKSTIPGAQMLALRSHGIQQIGLDRFEQAHEHHLRDHRYTRFASLQLCIQGGCRINVGGEDHCLSANQNLLIPGGRSRSIHIEGPFPTHMLWFRFKAKKYHVGADPRFIKAPTTDLLACFELLEQERATRKRTEMCERMAATLAVYLYDCLVEREPDHRLQELWAAVENKLNRNWQLDELAAEIGLRREQFRALCKRDTGLSPLHYLRLLRIRRAWRYLERDGLSVQQTATKVGYENAFAFSRAFRQVMGKPPSTLIRP